MRLIRHALALFVLLLASNAALAACQCCRQYDNNRCTLCTGISRGYAPLEAAPGTIWCTLCSGWCQSKERVTPVAEVSRYDATLRPMLVFIEKGTLFEIAAVNPEAAVMAHVLVLRSRTADATPPEKGDGGSTAKNTLRGALAAIAADGTSVSADPTYFEPYSNPAHATRWAWELTKRGAGRATLVLKHRVVNSADDVVLGAPFPDVEIELAWRRSQAAGYWSAVSWRTLQ